MEEGNSISGYLFIGEQPRIRLEQSNSYFYGSGGLSNRDPSPVFNDLSLYPSLAYA
jgi:hypothetical protein